MRTLLASAISGWALLAPGPAMAIGDYPPEITSHLSLGYEPPCSICHLAGVTGEGTVSTPFGLAMKSRGLQGESLSSLRDALDALAAEGIDSDADGVGDVDELIAGQDPNVADGDIDPQPAYGCELAPPSSRSGAIGPALGTLANVLLAGLLVLLPGWAGRRRSVRG